MRMGLTTVDILKMWLFTAELLQVMPQVEAIVVTLLLSLVSRLLWEGGEKKSLYTLFVHAQLYRDFLEFGNFHKICSVTLTSARHTDFPCIKDACH